MPLSVRQGGWQYVIIGLCITTLWESEYVCMGRQNFHELVSTLGITPCDWESRQSMQILATPAPEGQSFVKPAVRARDPDTLLWLGCDRSSHTHTTTFCVLNTTSLVVARISICPSTPSNSVTTAARCKRNGVLERRPRQLRFNNRSVRNEFNPLRDAYHRGMSKPLTQTTVYTATQLREEHLDPPPQSCWSCLFARGPVRFIHHRAALSASSPNSHWAAQNQYVQDDNPQQETEKFFVEHCLGLRQKPIFYDPPNVKTGSSMVFDPIELELCTNSEHSFTDPYETFRIQEQ